MISSVEKALRLLLALDTHGSWIGVRDLSRRVGYTPPTTHNLLKTLRALGFVEYNGNTKQYRLGLAAIRLGDNADPFAGIRSFARPYVERLANEFEESVIVLAWENEQAFVVDWIQADHPLAVTHNHGVIEHPVLLASGRVLLAYQDRPTQLRYAHREKLATLGPNCPETPESLIGLFDQIATEGSTVTSNVANSGIAAVAAPVFGADGRVALAIGCSAPVTRTTEAQIAAVRQRLKEMSAQMTRKLGGNPPTGVQNPAA